MSANLGTDVIKHTLDTTQSTTNAGTETFTHLGAGGNCRFIIAVRFSLGASGDRVEVDCKQRVPARSTSAGDDDNYDDDTIRSFSFRITGDTAASSSQKAYFSAGTNQHIISISPYYGATELILTYTITEPGGGASATNLLALTSWTHIAGAF